MKAVLVGLHLALQLFRRLVRGVLGVRGLDATGENVGLGRPRALDHALQLAPQVVVPAAVHALLVDERVPVANLRGPDTCLANKTGAEASIGVTKSSFRDVGVATNRPPGPGCFLGHTLGSLGLAWLRGHGGEVNGEVEKGLGTPRGSDKVSARAREEEGKLHTKTAAVDTWSD